VSNLRKSAGNQKKNNTFALHKKNISTMKRHLKSLLLRPLFRLFSFLADRTNGWAIFARPKLFFGSLMLGLGVSAASCFGGEDVTCYEPAPTCYDPVSVDSIAPPATDTTSATSVDPTENGDSIPPILCYAPVAPAEDGT
jgi:hypothetical protein